MFTLAFILVTSATTNFTTSIMLQAVARTRFTITIKTYTHAITKNTHAITKIVTATTPVKSGIIINTPSAVTRTRAITDLAPEAITFALGTAKILLWMVSFTSEDSF